MKNCSKCSKIGYYPELPEKSVEQRTLPFNSRTYGQMLSKLEFARTNDTLKETIRNILANNDRADLTCLEYLIDRLYPEYKEMINLLLVLK